MVSRPPSELDSPLSERAIQRTYEGFARSLRGMTISQLLELAARQAAELQALSTRMISETLWDYHRANLDSPVLSTTPPLPDGSRVPADRPSPRPEPSAPPARSSSPGRRLARALERQGMAVSAKRARAEGRR